MTPRVKFYEGTRNGLLTQSIHPAVFRVRYTRRRAGGGQYKIDELRCGHNEHDVRGRLQFADPHGDIRGEIAVTHVMDLAPVYA